MKGGGWCLKLFRMAKRSLKTKTKHINIYFTINRSAYFQSFRIPGSSAELMDERAAIGVVHNARHRERPKSDHPHHTHLMPAAQYENSRRVM